MTNIDRVQRAIHFKGPDMVPIRHCVKELALHWHGEKLFPLWKASSSEFADMNTVKVVHPEPEHIRPDGSYLKKVTDEWGVEWEEAIFGIMGHPVKFPLADLSSLDRYPPPQAQKPEGHHFERDKAWAADFMSRYYLIDGWYTIFEVMHAVRKFEDVLMDIYDDGPEINRLADIIVEERLGRIAYAAARGAHAIQLADDFGTQISLIVSPDIWRHFFKPRYLRLVNFAKSKGLDVWYHTCGHILPLFDDLASLGLDVLWVQLSCNDNKLLAAKYREHKIASELHVGRQMVATWKNADDVNRYVKNLRALFDASNGGLVYRAELDNEFETFESCKWLIEAFNKNKNY